MGRLKEKPRGNLQVWLVSWGKTVTGIRNGEIDVKVKMRKPVCRERKKMKGLMMMMGLRDSAFW